MSLRLGYYCRLHLAEPFNGVRLLLLHQGFGVGNGEAMAASSTSPIPGLVLMEIIVTHSVTA